MVAEDEIGTILARDEPLPAIAAALMTAAKDGGGLDNISLVLLRATP